MRLRNLTIPVVLSIAAILVFCEPSEPKTSPEMYSLAFIATMTVPVNVQNDTSSQHSISFPASKGPCGSNGIDTPIANLAPDESAIHGGGLQGGTFMLSVDVETASPVCSEILPVPYLDFRTIQCTISDGPAVECHREES